MRTSFKLAVIATALGATLLAATAEAQRPRGGGVGVGRGLPPPPGTGRLRNAAQGMCLDVAGWAGKGDADVLLWECNDDPDHIWSFTSDGELRNTLNGTCLDAAGTGGEQGANVDVFRCESLDDQHWKLIPRGQAGTFELRNVKRGLCLDVSGRVGGRGDDVLLWACDGGADQLWSFEAYAPRPVHRRPQAAEPARPMEEDRFRKLVTAVRSASFSDAQLTVIQQAVTKNYFRVGQVKNLIDLVAFSAAKLRVLEIGAPRIVDPENAFTVYDSFGFSADRAQARQILRRNGF